MRKQRDARIVTFEQDYVVNGVLVGASSGNPMKKGSVHAMHTNTVEQLKRQGIKIKVEKPDFEKLESKIKVEKAKAKKAAKEAEA